MNDINKNSLTKSNNFYVSMGLLQPKETLDEKYEGKLEIHLTPYTEISPNVEAVLEALANGVKMIDQHCSAEGYKPVSCTAFALYNYNGVLAICPVAKSYPTCLNPIRVDRSGQLSLSTGSIGAPIYRHQLEELVKSGYLAGYVKVI